MNSDSIKSSITRAAGIAVGWLAGRYHLDPTQVGAMMSDAGYVGSVAAFAVGAYQHWGMKKVPETSIAIAVAKSDPVSVAQPGDHVEVTGKVVG